MLANTTVVGEADEIAVMRHYFSKTSTFHGDFGTYFLALTPVFSEHTSSLASDLPRQLVSLANSDTFSTKPTIFANHTKTNSFRLSTQNKIKTNQTVQTFLIFH